MKKTSYETAQAMWDELVSDLRIATRGLSDRDFEAAVELLKDETGWTREELADEFDKMQDYSR